MSYEEQETCAVCGKRLSETEETELLDGYLCGECRKKLSPWFEEFDLAEPEEIRSQMALREQNLRRLSSFRPSRKFGGPTMVVVDDRSKTFVVTDTFHLKSLNPEILTLDQVLSCDVEVEEDREEIGSKLYRYSYQLFVVIDLDHEYLDRIRFPLNEEPLFYESREKSFLGFGGFDPENEPDYMELQEMGDLICNVLTDCEEEESPESCNVKPGEFDGEDAGPSHTAEQGKVVICPWCGCKTTVTDSFCCQNCGGNL